MMVLDRIPRLVIVKGYSTLRYVKEKPVDIEQDTSISFETYEEPIQKIATIIPVTEGFVQDTLAYESYIKTRVPQFLSVTAEQLVLDKIREVGSHRKAKLFHRVKDEVGQGLYDSYHESKMFPDSIVLPRHLYNRFIKKRMVDDPSRLAVSDGLNDGEILIGNFAKASQLGTTEVQTELSSDHSDFFKKDLFALRAQQGIAVLIYQSDSFQIIQTRVWPQKLRRWWNRTDVVRLYRRIQRGRRTLTI